MHELRPEQPWDFADVRLVDERAFAPSREEADLVEALRASGAHVPELCLVALRGGVVVGHVTFSQAHLDSGHPVLALAPMAVLPGYQRQGFGSALVSEGLRRAAETAFLMVVLVGHPTFYPRFGFEPAEPLGIDAPFEVPSEAWMAYRLPAYRREARGTVVYPAAFGM
jgi:putative acetyltransferase